MAEIRTLDAGSWFERDDPFDQVAAGVVRTDELASYVGEKIPTLREAFELNLDLDWSLNLELKIPINNGLTINPFTVNDPETMSRVIKLGVAGLITDFPQRVAR